MTVHVRLFAILRERAGADHVEVDLPEPATVADVLRAVSALPGLDAVGTGSVRMAVNREYVSSETLLHPADELALIPPVSGGAAPAAEITASRDGVTAIITSSRLDHEPEIQRMLSEHAGAVVTFSGYPRDIPALEYEAYPEMAIERMLAILAEARHGHGLVHASALHRVGEVKAFEASIIVAVSAPHRGPAFEGAREILDRIKAETPIWKVEVGSDGRRERPGGSVPEVSEPR